jgi:hypothetical protein
MTSKHCIKCELEKPFYCFNKNKSKKTGYQDWCRVCTKAYHQTQHSKDVRKSYTDNYQSGTKWKNSKKKASAKWDFLNREKKYAHGRISSGLRNKSIKKPIICEGCKENHKLNGHHEDYSKPLDVVWLCDDCHRFIHVLINIEENK